MSIKPILFSGPMVKAILHGNKSATRRVLKPQPDLVLVDRAKETGRWQYEMAQPRKDGNWESIKLPYQVGDVLWVRETFARVSYQPIYCPHYMADGPIPTISERHDAGLLKITPSIFMPRWAARIWLEVTGVKVERVQEISEEDAIAEGIAPFESFIGVPEPRAAFAALWDSINAKRGFGWEANPWVEAVTFKRIEKPEGI